MPNPGESITLDRRRSVPLRGAPKRQAQTVHQVLRSRVIEQERDGRWREKQEQDGCEGKEQAAPNYDGDRGPGNM